MVKIESRKKLVPLLLTFMVILLDQLTKALIVMNYPREGVFIADPFKNDFLWIIHVRNKAIAFSIGAGLPDGFRTVLFIALPFAVIIGLVVYYFRSNEFTQVQRWAVAGIIGGGIGNLLDRAFRPAGVVDFISVNFYGLLGLSRWPTFNIADSSVVVCGLLLFVSVILMSGHKKGDPQL
jgi:signal peptidase II